MKQILLALTVLSVAIGGHYTLQSPENGIHIPDFAADERGADFENFAGKDINQPDFAQNQCKDDDCPGKHDKHDTLAGDERGADFENFADMTGSPNDGVADVEEETFAMHNAGDTIESDGFANIDGDKLYDDRDCDLSSGDAGDSFADMTGSPNDGVADVEEETFAGVEKGGIVPDPVIDVEQTDQFANSDQATGPSTFA